MSDHRKRGFAAMSPEKQRMIASKGGREAHRQGTAHEFSSEKARAAGRLSRKIISANRISRASNRNKSGKRLAPRHH